MKKIRLDDGFSYGMGIFETIALEKGRLIFLKEHLERLAAGLQVLQIPEIEILKQFQEKESWAYLEERKDVGVMKHGALKIMVSTQNVVFTLEKNKYTKEDYVRGFELELSKIKRNESSPLTYIKSLNYGDNILEKRRAHSLGYDEPVFLNSQGYLAEGAVSNLFFRKGEQYYTPEVKSGLLPGIMRKWVIENFPVKETRIKPEEITQFDEMFVTNSLMGIMPVRRFGKITFSSMQKARKIQNYYKKSR